ncbi:MAG: homoserine kinase [bacterium]
MENKKIIVEVPASSGNLGCGFDVLSAALNIKNRFVFCISPGLFSLKIKVSGFGKESVALSAKNIVWKAALSVFRKTGFSYKNLGQIKILEENRIPLMKGLGSSASARLAGAFFANEVSGKKLGNLDILKIVASAEGHYDNASAALFGGIAISVPAGKNVEVIPLKNKLKNPICLAVPEIDISTDESRRILPDKYSKKDVIFNLSRISSLLAGIHAGNVRPFMFEDMLHTPFRKKLIPGFDEVKKAALGAGACGVFISGSGSSVGAVAKDMKNAGKISGAMKKAFGRRGIKSSVIITKIANEGIKIVSLSGRVK